MIHHFATVGLLGALLATCVAYAASPASIRGVALRTPMRRGLLYIGGGLALAIVFYGFNNSWLLSNLGLPFQQAPPSVFGVALSTLSAVLGFGAGAASILVGLIRQSSPRPAGPQDEQAAQRPDRRMATAIALALSACLLFESSSFVYALARRQGKYTLGASTIASLTGSTCGVADALLVESDPSAGALGVGAPALSAFDTMTPGTSLLTWRAPGDRPASLTSGWIPLPPSARRGELPLVVATHGVGAANAVTVQLRSSASTTFVPVAPAQTVPLPGTDLVDFRMNVSTLAPSATEFRVVANATGTTGTVGALAVAAPRVPAGPSLQRYTAGATVATSWINAFFYPCLTQPETVNGRAQVAAFQVTTEDPNADGGNYNPAVTGSFAGVAAIVRRQEVPVYLRGDPTRVVAHLFRFVPRCTSVLDRPALRDVTRSGVAATTPLLIPAR